jgi:hypothetical protein
MKRLSQLMSHIAQGTNRSSASTATATPHRAEDGDTTTNMAKPKVVVTRQLIDEAQAILDGKKQDLEIVQWNSEKVGYVFKTLMQWLTRIHSHARAPGFSKMLKEQQEY